MNDKVDFQRRGFNRRDVLKTAGAGLAAAALPSIPAMAQDPVELTLWSWLPNFQDQVDMFEAAHPNIKVKLVNAGQGGDE
jgi:multiple sugar transport system substrate-binding protein